MIRYDLADLLKKVDSRYTLVIAAAKRARQINDYLNAVKKQEIPHVVPPQVEFEDIIEDKPITIAFREISEGKLKYSREETA